MPGKFAPYILLIFLCGCASVEGFIENLIGEEVRQNILFSEKASNRYFNYRQLSGQNVAILPIRSSMGGGGGDERVAPVLVPIIREKLPRMNLITDDQADSYFTDNDIWDDYFSYVAYYSAKGLVDIDTLTGLYSQLRVTTVLAVTSDLFFTGVEGMYPRNFNTYMSMQVLDMRSKQVIWDGMVEMQEVIMSKEETEGVVIKTYQKIAQRLLAELTR